MVCSICKPSYAFYTVIGQKIYAKKDFSKQYFFEKSFQKLSRGLEPPASALPRRRATDCAKTAYHKLVPMDIVTS